MGGLISNIFLPIKAGYIKLFEINKYFAVFVLSSSTTLFLFVLMVALISLGDSGLKEDKSVKLADIVMPEREIDTFQLLPRLKAISSENKNVRIYVRGDKNVPYGWVLDTIAKIKSSGFKKVALVAKLQEG